MTIPMERTRAIRFGGELLMELQSADNVTAKQRFFIDVFLLHYPTGREIELWAADGAGLMLGPEDPNAFGGKRFFTRNQPDLPSRTTTPAQRTMALRSAYEFFRFSLPNAENLTSEQKNQIPYVLRHFPEPHELGAWARSDEWESARNPKIKQWLAPETESTKVTQ